MGVAECKLSMANLEKLRAIIMDKALKYSLDPAVVAGVLVRETWAGAMPAFKHRAVDLKKAVAGFEFCAGVGDYRRGRYNGYGIAQMDIGSYAKWIETHNYCDPRQAIEMECQILADNRRSVRAVMPHVTDSELYKTACAGYNAGIARCRNRALQGRDPDGVTTGRNYGADVLVNADWLHREMGFVVTEALGNTGAQQKEGEKDEG